MLARLSARFAREGDPKCGLAGPADTSEQAQHVPDESAAKVSQAQSNMPPVLSKGIAAGSGGLCGALAGLFVALGDFGATWLWLPLWRDRGDYLVRMLALAVPAGALLGALLTLAGFAAYRAAAKSRYAPDKLWPLPLVMLSTPVWRLLALKLCSGGMMSRLSFRGALEWGLSALLPLLFYAGLLGLSLFLRALHQRPRFMRPSAAALFGLSFGLGKLNQTFLPNLYDYLHAALSALTWLSAGLGFYALLRDPCADRFRSALSSRWAVRGLSLGLFTGFVFNLLTLDQSLNVRVAMFDPRSATSRVLLTGLNPALLVWSKHTRETRTRNARKSIEARPQRDADLPSTPGAHVVIITIDALRADHMSSYGYARDTSPELTIFAQGAVQFERAYAQAPHSSYSLSSLHTSEYLHEVVELGRPLPEATLASTLAEHGYHTAAFFTDGIFHTDGHRLARYRDNAFGFALFDHTNRESEDQTERVLTEVERIKQQGEPPSFLWVHYFDVHEPYQETTFGTGEMERYDSEIRHVDREVMRLLRALDERFEREVIVAITADHGEEFREHGGVYHGSTLYEEQVRVPLILRAPGLPASRIDAPVEVVDIAPTLLGAADIPVPASMRGRDLRAYALGKIPENSTAFSAVLTKRMAVQWPYKLIADLRFGLFELYNLSEDPEERRNLASSQPEKLGEMRDLIYNWLDSLESAPGAAGVADAQEDAWTRAIAWGRLGDRRAVEPMSKLLLDTNAPTAMRTEAGQILAKLADESCADALVAGMDTTPFEVAAEAAIALGRMYDPRARDALRRLMHVEDPFVRARAAVSLGRLRDTAAVPALIDALLAAPTQYEREEAVRWLGRLRDPRALEPLLSLLPEFGLRYLVTVSLGLIGDPRAYTPLAEMMRWESHTNIRDELVRGLGYLGDARAIPLLVEALAGDPALKNTGESLVRLKAIERGHLGGTDFSPDTPSLHGFGKCRAAELFHDWDYLERTTCMQTSKRASASLKLPRTHTDWKDGATLVLRARRAEGGEPSSLSVALQGKPLATLSVNGMFQEFRLDVPASALNGSSVRLEFEVDGQVYVEVDHALLLPRSQPDAQAQPVN